MEYCQSLQFEDEPDYKFLLSLFKELYTAKDYENDFVYEWILVKNNTRALKDASLCQSDEYSKAQKQIDGNFKLKKRKTQITCKFSINNH